MVPFCLFFHRQGASYCEVIKSLQYINQFIFQNLYASKPSIRNQIKTDNFKSYEDLGKVKKFVFRELQQDETVTFF